MNTVITLEIETCYSIINPAIFLNVVTKQREIETCIALLTPRFPLVWLQSIRHLPHTCGAIAGSIAGSA